MRRRTASPEQLRAAEPRPGPVRVVAGAGTGKTAVIARRYANLVAAGVPPAEILVLTFSERAAAELRERIAAAAAAADLSQIGTFHALGLRWLREDGIRLGISPTFGILAGPERWVLLRELMWTLGQAAHIGVERPDDLVLPLLELLERLKQELVPPGRLEAWARAAADRSRGEQLLAASRLFAAYASECRRRRLLDFADLLTESVRLLETHDEVRRRHAIRHRWLMVDEYQDTNLAQERLVELLSRPAGNVFVVGDDDQSIYRFRGASRASLERFQASFPHAERLGLGLNLRSTGRIVEAAAQVIGADPERLPKRVAAARGPGRPVTVSGFPDGAAEATSIAAEVARLIDSGLSPGSIALLTRTHALGRPLTRALGERGIDYQHWSRHGFYQRPEVRDVIAYLMLLQDPDDLPAVLRAAAAPPLAMDQAAALALIRAGARAGECALAAVGAAPAAGSWSRALLELVGRSRRLGVAELFFEVMSATRYLEAGQPGAERAAVVENVSRFAELIDEYCERRSDHSLSVFLDHLRLMQLSGLDEEQPATEASAGAVQVMTIHQAKGLEFDAVFLPALVEGRLPQPARSGRSESHFEVPPQVLEPLVRGREDHLAEERRLCYVAMTRARARLYLSWAERYEGARTWRRSRFLSELEKLPAGAVRFRTVAPAPREQTSDSNGAAPANPPAGPPLAALDRQLQLSFSSVATYRECPRRYWFRYEQRLPAAPSVEGQYGALVHDALRRAGELRQRGPLRPEDLRRAHDQAWAEAELADPRRRPALERLGWQQVERYAAAGGFDRAPHLVERSFTADLDSWSLHGIIDRVDESPPPTQKGGEVGNGGASAGGSGTTGWRLLDYKTGSPLPVSSLRRDLQLALYALGARDGLGLAAAELEIVYLQTGRSLVLAADEELVTRARSICDEVAAGIRSGHFEARPETRRCRVCPYRLPCREGL